MTNLSHYFHRMRELPVQEVVPRGLKLVRRIIQNRLSLIQARIFGTHISDRHFRSALVASFADECDLVSHFQSGNGPSFFISPYHKDLYISNLRQHYRNSEKLVIGSADRVCDHIFDLLGSGPTSLGKNIDWHTDFKSGHRWNSDKYYTEIRPAPYPGGYDIKVPWELSRSQHFIWLGQAYWFTGDEKYATEFVAQVLDWIEHNPPKFGANWACTMEVAIRAVNWLWGLHFFRNSQSLSDDFIIAIYKSLLEHGRFIIKNLERYETSEGTLTSNHYLADIVGLIYLGILLPEFKDAGHWREFGLRELEQEMFRQVYPDGVDFEASTSYHRLVTEMFLSAVILAKMNDHKFSHGFMQKLEKMIEFVMYVTKPDGSVPLIGDNDNGRIHRLKVWSSPRREWADFRYLLAIGAVLYEREDFALKAENQWEDAIWLFGEKAVKYQKMIESAKLPPVYLSSRSFHDAGYFTMRHEDVYLIVNAGPVGQNGNGGHAHNHFLSFELFAAGQPWIIDPGAFVYTDNYEARNRFRSTEYHNTIVVDDENQNRYNSHELFQMSNDTHCKVLAWETSKFKDHLIAEHYGYQRLLDPVVHRREITFDKAQKKIDLIDKLIAAEKHGMRLLLHFSPGLFLSRDQNDAQIIVESEQQSIRLRIQWDDVFIDGFEILPGEISLGYGVKQRSEYLAIICSQNYLNTQILW